MDTAQFFDIQALTFDPELQVRVRINDEQVAQYAECMTTEEDMKAFPPVEIFYDGVKYWLADGHHRRAAAEKAGHTKIWAIVKSGTHDDALWAAIIANGKQGLALTREDKKRAIEISVKKWPKKSNRTLASAVGCDERTIRRIRESFSGAANAAPEKEETVVVGKDGKSYPAKQKTKKQNATNESPSSAPEESTEFVTDEAKEVEIYPEPPCPNKDVKYFPKTTLKLIPQESPRVLLVNLFEIFREGFVEEMILMAFDMLLEDKGKSVVKKLLTKLNKKHG